MSMQVACMMKYANLMKHHQSEGENSGKVARDM
jgi:hypothetical protein